MPFCFALILKVKYNERIVKAIEAVQSTCSLSSQEFTSAFLYHMDIADVNYYLFSCENEEREIWKNGLYFVPGYRHLFFGGFAGVVRVLRETSLNNDFHHPLFRNIMEGDYLLDYYEQRIRRYNKRLHSKFLECFCAVAGHIKQMPVVLKPHYFHRFVSLIVSAFENKFLEHVQTQDFFLSNTFFRQLLLAIPQFLTPGSTKDLYLPSAGLPHFSVGCWKNWGRDTFISFNGVFLLTGMYSHGKAIILEYARYLRHGLIPNMMMPSRYNSRDATWWFIYSVKNYLEETGDYKILQQKVNMVYLSDDQEQHNIKSKDKQILHRRLIDLLQEIFQKHAQGISFREWNSHSIDECMTDQGFNISLNTDWKTGFVYGGNKHNCLTWMDKMGSSFKAGNRGVPATPRFGAPIELTALLYVGLKMMKMLYQEGLSSYDGVTGEGDRKMTYKEWKRLIKQNFERHYWIPVSETEDEQFKIEKPLVFRRGIFKDCLSGEFHDYQLRPNALIAVSLLASFLSKEKINSYLSHAKNHLIVC